MKAEGIVIELIVNNHPGVMSHICGLFSRRAYNLENILCLPLEDRATSRIWLQVNEEQKLEQVVKQLKKLEDVRQVVCGRKNDPLFNRVEALIQHCLL